MRRTRRGATYPLLTALFVALSIAALAAFVLDNPGLAALFAGKRA